MNWLRNLWNAGGRESRDQNDPSEESSLTDDNITDSREESSLTEDDTISFYPLLESVGTNISQEQEESSAEKRREKLFVGELSRETLGKFDKEERYKQSSKKTCVFASLINVLRKFDYLENIEDAKSAEKFYEKQAKKFGVYNPKKGMNLEGAKRFVEEVTGYKAIVPENSVQLFEELKSGKGAVIGKKTERGGHTLALREYKGRLLFVDPDFGDNKKDTEDVPFTQEVVNEIFEEHTFKDKDKPNILIIGDINSEPAYKADNKKVEKPIIKPED